MQGDGSSGGSPPAIQSAMTGGDTGLIAECAPGLIKLLLSACSGQCLEGPAVYHRDCNAARNVLLLGSTAALAET